MAGQAVSSVVQLSALTTITSISRENTYNDFPVTLRVRAQETTAARCPPVDVVALVDVSGSVRTSTRLENEKAAMEEVAKHLGSGGWNRLAVVAFNNTCIPLKMLEDTTDEWRQNLHDQGAAGDTNIVQALNTAAKILDTREPAEKQGRPAFIVLLSDGLDPYFDTSKIPTTYPIHAFGFWAETPSALEAIRDEKLGTYTPVNERIEKVSEKLGELSGELASMLAVDTRVTLRTLHPGVTLSRVEVEPSHGVGIGEDKESGEVFLGVLRSGNEREFTVYLNVPPAGPVLGRKNGAVDDDASSSMELLTVGGSYKQSWDEQLVALDECVVTVARPGGSSRCKELVDGIEERLEYWCKVKQDLYYSGFNDDSKCQCLISGVLREASLEAINIAMHQDIYMAVQHAIKLRHSGNGGTTMENAPAPTPV